MKKESSESKHVDENDYDEDIENEAEMDEEVNEDDNDSKEHTGTENAEGDDGSSPKVDDMDVPMLTYKRGVTDTWISSTMDKRIKIELM